MDQLMALSIIPDNLDSAAKAIADMNVELEKERAAKETT
jgi:hypothetical protein